MEWRSQLAVGGAHLRKLTGPPPPLQVSVHWDRDCKAVFGPQSPSRQQSPPHHASAFPGPTFVQLICQLCSMILFAILFLFKYKRQMIVYTIMEKEVSSKHTMKMSLEFKPKTTSLQVKALFSPGQILLAFSFSFTDEVSDDTFVQFSTRDTNLSIYF